MKNFAEWQSSRANSIVDKSEFIKPCSCGSPSPSPSSNNTSPTELQIRMAYANLLYPKTNTSPLAREWVNVFASQGSLGVSLLAVLGTKGKEFYSIEDYEEPVWLMGLRREIAQGKTSWDE